MDAILCVGAFLMMLWYSPLLTLIALVLSLLPLGASLVAGKHLASREQEVSRKNDSFLSMVKDGLTGFSVVKSFKAEKDILLLFSQSNAQAQEAKRRRMCLAQVLRSLGSVAGVVAQFGVFLAAAVLALAGKGVTPGVAGCSSSSAGFPSCSCRRAPRCWPTAGRLWPYRQAGGIPLPKRPGGGRAHPQKAGRGHPGAGPLLLLPRGEEVLHHVNAQFQAGRAMPGGASGSGSPPC